MPKFTPEKLGFGQPDAGGAGDVPVLNGMVASGGVINDYQAPDSKYWRAHIFYNSGELVVASNPNNYGQNIEFLVIAGAGGGGCNPGPANGPRGGGGAGGLRTNASPTYSENLPAAAIAYPGSGSYTYNVDVGSGGWFGSSAPPTISPLTKLGGNGQQGEYSRISIPTAGGAVYATGGGGGTGHPDGNGPGLPATSNKDGGSGGGGCYGDGGGSTEASPDPLSPTVQGFIGGHPGPHGGPSGPGGYGGGGAGSKGLSTPGVGNHGGGMGGAGVQVLIGGDPTWNQAGGYGPGPTGLTNQWFAGGGGGGGGYPGGSGGAAGYGGGKPAASTQAEQVGWALNNYAGAGDGADAPNNAPAPSPATEQFQIMAQNGWPFSGGGGGSGTGGTSFDNMRYAKGGSGAPGICIMRYQIGAIGESPTKPSGQQAKATGGNISFYNNKVIHSFYNSGSFVTDAGFNETIEWVTIGGGGGSGANVGGPSFSDGAGGGGAGGFNTKSDPVSTPTSTSFTITVGRGGIGVGRQFTGGYCGQEGNGSSVTFGAPSPTSEWPAIPGAYKSYGGGGGGSGGSPTERANGTAGASGAGGASNKNEGSASYPGSPVVQGYDGTSGSSNAPQGGGAGGGAGAAGADTPPTYGGANGGHGKQLPTTFRDPNQQFGAYNDLPGSGSWYWVGGGGGGGACHPPAGPYGGNGGAGGGGFGGGRSPTTMNPYQRKYFSNTERPYPIPDMGDSESCCGWRGMDGCGGGAGGASGSANTARPASGNDGGSGLVLIAYPT